MAIPLDRPTGAHLARLGPSRPGEPGRGTRDRVLRSATTSVHQLLYLLSAVLLAPVWLALLIIGWVLTIVLAITPLLPLALLGFGVAVRHAAWVEGALARRLLGAPTRPRRLAVHRRGYWSPVPGVLGSSRFWTAQALLLLRTVLGLVTAIVVVAVLAAGVEGVLAPLLHRVIPADGTTGIDLGFWLVDTLPESLLLVPVGLVVLVVGVGLLRAGSALWRAIATSLVGTPIGGEDV